MGNFETWDMIEEYMDRLLAGGGIGRGEEWYRVHQTNDLERIYRERANRAKHDLLGTILNSEIIHLLGYDGMDTLEMRQSWEQIEDYLRENVDKKVYNDISELITSFGTCQEEKGFKEGFQITHGYSWKA